MKTSEGIEFWAFVSEPRKLADKVSLCNGKSIKEWLSMKFDNGYHFGIDNLRQGFYKEGGWCFDLRPFMNKYIYTNCGSVYVGFAPSVKGLRSANCLNRNERVALAPKGF